MKKLDIAICALVIALGLVWFAAAEVVYDGSLMENPFWRSGMLAVWYVPIATMYLTKSAMGDGGVSAVIASAMAFLVFWAMIAVDVWVTHFKPDSDYCCIPASECFLMESISAMIIVALAGFADIVSSRLVKRIRHPIARWWLVRRVMRVIGMFLITCLFCVVAYWILYVVLRMAWWFWKMIAQ